MVTAEPDGNRRVMGAAARALLLGFRSAAATRKLIQGGGGNLDKDDLLATAQQAVGRTDFGEAPLQGGLRRLLRACNADARLTTLGRDIVRAECVRILENRLRMEMIRARRPEIGVLPVREPVFIVGFPRSGTTFVHELLAQLPGLRAPRLQEMLFPVSAYLAEPPPRDPRSGIRWLQAVSPELSGIHRVALDTPEECTFLLQHTFRSFVFGVTLHTPSYVTWMIGQDMVPAYAFHRWQLQLLSRGDGGPTWVLKSPAHAFFLDAISAVYPDARFIHLHRDPAHALASFCSLRETVLRLTSTSVRREEIGKYSLMALRVAAVRMMGSRRRLDASRVLDIRHRDVMSDPDVVGDRLVDFLQLSRREEAKGRIRDWLMRAPPRKGRHRYRLATYGLDRCIVSDHFDTYRKWSHEVCRGSA